MEPRQDSSYREGSGCKGASYDRGVAVCTHQILPHTLAKQRGPKGSRGKLEAISAGVRRVR